MENNVKVYEVTITTEEYKTLITEAAENRKEAEMERNKRWNTEYENKALIEENKLLKERVAELERDCIYKEGKNNG